MVYLPTFGWVIFRVNAGKYTIHGAFGIWMCPKMAKKTPPSDHFIGVVMIKKKTLACTIFVSPSLFQTNPHLYKFYMWWKNQQ